MRPQDWHEDTQLRKHIDFQPLPFCLLSENYSFPKIKMLMWIIYACQTCILCSHTYSLTAKSSESFPGKHPDIHLQALENRAVTCQGGEQCPVWTLVSLKVPVSPVLLPSGIYFGCTGWAEASWKLSESSRLMLTERCSVLMCLPSDMWLSNCKYLNGESMICFSQLSGCKQDMSTSWKWMFPLTAPSFVPRCLSLTYQSSSLADNSSSICTIRVEKYLGDSESHLGHFELNDVNLDGAAGVFHSDSLKTSSWKIRWKQMRKCITWQDWTYFITKSTPQFPVSAHLSVITRVGVWEKAHGHGT